MGANRVSERDWGRLKAGFFHCETVRALKDPEGNATFMRRTKDPKQPSLEHSLIRWGRD
jgi:hypothetical protein